MKYIVGIVIFLLSLALTSGVFPYFRLAGAVPDLFLLLVLIGAAEFDDPRFLLFVLGAGLWIDVYFGLPIGSYAIGYVLCGAVTQLLFHQPLAFEFNWKHFIVLVIATTLLLYALWLPLYTSTLF